MAGWVTTALTPAPLNTPSTWFTGGTPSSYGYVLAGTSTLAVPTAWGSNNVVFVQNPSGNVILWYYCDGTGAGVAQVLVGEQVAGQVLPASTTRTIGASESGWFGPYSPATYNIVNVANVPSGVAGSPSGNMPAAAAGCFAVAFTTTTTLLVAAYSLSAVQP
jgi:hypothetical protein